MAMSRAPALKILDRDEPSAVYDRSAAYPRPPPTPAGGVTADVINRCVLVKVTRRIPAQQPEIVQVGQPVPHDFQRDDASVVPSFHSTSTITAGADRLVPAARELLKRAGRSGREEIGIGVPVGHHGREHVIASSSRLQLGN